MDANTDFYGNDYPLPASDDKILTSAIYFSKSIYTHKIAIICIVNFMPTII